MPRPKKIGAPEPKRRSRTGCWPCKTRKVKCDEARPICVNCQRQGETCDYSIRLNWEGRGKKRPDSPTASMFGQVDFTAGDHNEQISVSVPTPFINTDIPTRPSPSKSVETEWHSPNQREPTNNATQRTSSETVIDPALINSNSPTSLHQPQTFALPQTSYQHAQSYERHKPSASTVSASANPSSISKLRQSFEDEPSSSTKSGIQNPSVNGFITESITLPNIDSPRSTPPFYSNARDDVELPGMQLLPLPADRPHKRARYHVMPASSGTVLAPFNTLDSHIATSPNSFSTPLTPTSSHSDDGYRSYTSKLSPPITHDSPDLRRLSVSALLSGPPGIPFHDGPRSMPENQTWTETDHDAYQDTTTWGIDRGFKDLDIGKNDDANAISGSSPLTMRDHLDLVLNEDGGIMPVEFGFGMETSDTASENGGYYDKPVPICIPRALEPLPSKLLENPMNLLYFHHFLNNTAGCLVPHNCSSNPFRSVLPRMAVQDDDLLNLLLAYSASHRARLLRQPEPATRIALWVQDIFPNLRNALDDPGKIISNANLATAIMLASLEIISPTAFGVAIPWQRHLDTAREIIAARGGPPGMRTAARADKVSSFLWSWFVYLDVLGSLSGVTTSTTSSSSSWVLDYQVRDEVDYEIDCILGFTSRCLRLLAKVAELARICDKERIGADLSIKPGWKPSEDMVTRAKELESDLAESRLHPAKPCTHMQSSGEAAYQCDSLEMAATNEAFHWAGLVHLHRRVLGKPSTHPDVQIAVKEIHGALYKVRPGGSATACLIFPIFTAGCDTQDEKQRTDILERIKGVESFGMTQVHKARTLMERAWETGKPWETLVAGEFFG